MICRLSWASAATGVTLQPAFPSGHIDKRLAKSYLISQTIAAPFQSIGMDLKPVYKLRLHDQNGDTAQLLYWMTFFLGKSMLGTCTGALLLCWASDSADRLQLSGHPGSPCWPVLTVWQVMHQTQRLARVPLDQAKGWPLYNPPYRRIRADTCQMCSG